jgi:MoxR-like ATPase
VDLDEVRAVAKAVKDEVAKAIVGQDEAIDLLLTALFCGGHVLLEGPPGAAKTFMAQCFARATSLDFGRIQFTPDLMPGDIIGSSLFDFQTSAFRLVKGPVFCQLLLADEINRTPPKTQAALLEAMQERAVTIDGERHPLGDRFTVVATQNPIEHQGTYPLPEAQLDRFLFKHVIGYPTEEEERAVVARHGLQTQGVTPETFGIKPVGTVKAITGAIAAVHTVRLNDEIVDYVVALVRGTRDSGDLMVGASPRCSTMLARAARVVG